LTLEEKKLAMSMKMDEERTYAAAMKSSKVFPCYRALDCTGNTRRSTYLGFSSSGPVPFVTEFASTPDVWSSKNYAVHLQKSENHRTEERIRRYPESTITCAEKKKVEEFRSDSLR
jgi:hypothetical protein